MILKNKPKKNKEMTLIFVCVTVELFVISVVKSTVYTGSKKIWNCLTRLRFENGPVWSVNRLSFLFFLILN